MNAVYNDRFSKEYKDYINSWEWQKKRLEFIRLAGYKCQRCGRQGSVSTLHVHHKTYERLGNELPQDVMVLCSECHKEEDAARRVRVQVARDRDRFVRRLNAWATKVYGENWADYKDFDVVEDEFCEWLRRREERGEY